MRVTMPHHPVDPDGWFDEDEITAVWQAPAPPRRVPCATPSPFSPPVLRPLRPVQPIAGPVFPDAPQAIHKPRRRWLRRLALIAAVAAGLVTAAAFGAAAWVRGEVRDALPGLAARLDRPVTAGDIDVRWSEITVHDLEVVDLAAIDRVVVRFTVTDLLGGRVRIDSIDAHGVETWIDRAAVDDLLVRFGSEVASAATRDAPGRVDTSAARLTAHDVTVHASAAERGVWATVEIATLEPIDGGVSITGATVEASGDSRLARLLAANPVTGVSGSVSRAGGALRFNLAGRLTDSESWRASGSIDRDRRSAEVRLGGSGVALRRGVEALALVSPRRLPLTGDDAARVGGDITLSITPAELIARGTVELDGVGVTSRRLAPEPIRLTGSLELDVTADLRGAAVKLDRAVWRAAAAPDARFVLTGSARREPRTLEAVLEIPRAACADVLASLPAALVPQLQGFELAGDIDARLAVAIDWARLDKTRLDAAVSIDGCQVLAAPAAMSADRLRGSFEHSVSAGGIHRTFVVGRENPDFVAVDHVSRNLIRSLLTTEDGSFWRHRGFRLDAFRTALIRNLEAGRFAYGGSSITMQMVKNVMLGRQKTISRKVQELFLTWYVESELPKKRILEIYLNAIEFGPGLYGIKPAAEQYFGKHPRRLNPVESAFFSSILPAPRRRFAQYCRGYVAGWTRNKMDRIIDLMFDRNRLDPEQYLDAIETPLIFRGKRRELCKYLEKGAK